MKGPIITVKEEVLQTFTHVILIGVDMWTRISNTQPLLSISVWAQVMFLLWIGNETQSLSPLGLWFKCSLGQWWLYTKWGGCFYPISLSPC